MWIDSFDKKVQKVKTLHCFFFYLFSNGYTLTISIKC